MWFIQRQADRLHKHFQGFLCSTSLSEMQFSLNCVFRRHIKKNNYQTAKPKLPKVHTGNNILNSLKNLPVSYTKPGNVYLLHENLKGTQKNNKSFKKT